VLVVAGTALLASSAILPPPASAQTRVAVRAVRRPVVVRNYYYRAPFYRPWYGIGYPWYPGFYYGYQRPYYDLSGSLRLQVSPRETEVFIDGYYAGTVDDFDGMFQRLHVEPGEHDIELYLPGHRSVHQQIYLQPGRTSRIRLTMEPLGPGEPAPVRPAGAAPPPTGPPQGAGPGRRPSAAPGVRDDPSVAEPAGSQDSAYGSVSIRVQPGDADILIDGEAWEGPEGERLVVQLSTGRHVLQVQKDGYRRYTTEITVRGGETTALNVALTPE
jgi:hypothetical protein